MSLLDGFSLSAVFAGAVIEGGMHILVHYFKPISNLMTHVAGVVVPGLDVVWMGVGPVMDFIGIGDLFNKAAGQDAFLDAILAPVP